MYSILKHLVIHALAINGVRFLNLPAYGRVIQVEILSLLVQEHIYYVSGDSHIEPFCKRTQVLLIDS